MEFCQKKYFIRYLDVKTINGQVRGKYLSKNAYKITINLNV